MDHFFKIKERGSTVSREIIGGITTFLAMSYILALNPGMLGEIKGMAFGGVFTATAVSAAVATLVMAFLANMPVALASGMGLNAFFTFTVCGQMGCSYQFALTAVLIEGLLFVVLSFFGVREAIIKSIPTTMKKAVTVGIGLFIVLIGLNNAGIVSSSNGTIISFNPFDMNHLSVIVAIAGLIITIVLYILKVPGAILIGIAATTVIGIPFGVTSVPKNFSPVSMPAAPFLFKFDFANVLSLKFFGVFFTFLFTDIFDTIGTLMGVAEQGKLVDENGNIPKAKEALLADSIGTITGACLGTSTVTSFVESSSGVAAGARTGLASVVTAAFFLLALFFTPLFDLVPSCATTPALVFVGFLMMQSVTSIDFSEITDGIPAFITIIVMPFGYSISKGIAFGMIAYVISKVAGGKAKEIPVVTWILAVVFVFALAFKAI
ncbi:NCS2 family permease [Treponema sp.]|uniref:NCS2 family permease n=1 Tax=Treponema sp. TaxID=166 RepID=UPI003F0D3ED3